MAIPPEWRPFFALGLGTIGWLVAKKRGWVNGSAATEVNAVLNNHFSDLAVEVREMTESLRALDATLDRHNTDLVLLHESTMRQGDIQIAVSRNMNEYNKLMILMADRMQVDRPNIVQLPQTQSERDAFSLGDRA